MKMIKTYASRLMLALLMAIGLLFGGEAFAATNASQIISEASDAFGLVQTLVLSVVAFWVIIKFARMAKKA